MKGLVILVGLYLNNLPMGSFLVILIHYNGRFKKTGKYSENDN